eukprot:jgi/Chlat1/3632/Chrsp237S03610
MAATAASASVSGAPWAHATLPSELRKPRGVVSQKSTPAAAQACCCAPARRRLRLRRRRGRQAGCDATAGDHDSGAEASTSQASDKESWDRWNSSAYEENEGNEDDQIGPFGLVDHEHAAVDYLGESTEGNLHMRDFQDYNNEEPQSLDSVQQELDDAIDLLRQIDLNTPVSLEEVGSRGIFCSRTLNLRSISTIGYDMDYTLVHYYVEAWEGRAYDYGMQMLREMGCRTDGLAFDPGLVIRGLVMDTELGNLVKADRFGYVKRAMHGTHMLSHRSISEVYGRELVDLRNEGRWLFLNTLFSVSEAVMYMQMVERLDEGALPSDIASLSYKGLYNLVAKALFRAHVEGNLKAEIMADPGRFVDADPDAPLALLDQKRAGKRLVLITNSDYEYTDRMMTYAYTRYLPDGMTWRSLFDMVIVSARKPEFFTSSNMPLYEVVTEDGLMRPCYRAKPGGLYNGGCAAQVERALDISGDETMYVGDHIYTDVNSAKTHLRWRTALICRELEHEVQALTQGRYHREELQRLMLQKAAFGDAFNQFRLLLQRAQATGEEHPWAEQVTSQMSRLLLVMDELDERIAPMLEEDGWHFNQRWGYLSRSGLNDKSHLTRQIEKYADIYTSRVSNFLRYTPFMYFRSPSQSLAHDPYSTEDYQSDTEGYEPVMLESSLQTNGTSHASSHESEENIPKEEMKHAASAKYELKQTLQ